MSQTTSRLHLRLLISVALIATSFVLGVTRAFSEPLENCITCTCKMVHA